MRVNTVLLLLVFSSVLFFSFLIIRLNGTGITLDLFFTEIQSELGFIILISFLVGSLLTLFLEILYKFRKTRKYD